MRNTQMALITEDTHRQADLQKTYLGDLLHCRRQQHNQLIYVL